MQVQCTKLALGVGWIMSAPLVHGGVPLPSCCSEVVKCGAQGFEGLALGGSFVMAGYSRLKYGLMAAAFILITPIGVAIGLGISSSFNPNSKAALVSEGAFNSISAGEAPEHYGSCISCTA